MIRRRQSSSRLNRTSEKQNKKQATLFTLGIIILIAVLIQFGPLLVNVFGSVVYTLRGGDQSDSTQIVGNAVLQPPILIDVPEATQSSKISFSGTSTTDRGSIEIYVNDDLKDEIELKNTHFNVENLYISKGKNVIKARLSQDDKTSPFSEDYEVKFIIDKPKLEVSFPVDNATFSKADKNITIHGTTDPDNSVSVNAFRAIVDSNGEFSYLMQLNDGENQISIEAKNPAGVSSQKQVKVTYTP